MTKKKEDKYTDDSSLSKLGRRVKELRMSLGFTQSELGNLIGSIPHQSIQNVESGKVQRPRYLQKLASVLGTTTDFLTGGVQQTQLDKVIFKQCLKAVQTVGSELTLDQQTNLVVYLYDDCIKTQSKATPEKIQSMINIFA
jgi:transcriptional regulator with XRE-family HTH domain